MPATYLSSAITVAAFALALASPAHAASVTEKAKESGCSGKPKQVEGTMFKCETGSGAWSYFNVPEMSGSYAAPPAPRNGTANGNSNGNGANGVAPAPAPRTSTGFPRVDPETQKGRDDVRRRVLQEELAAEEKLLAESRMQYADGAPAPLPEERTNAERYRERIARLRQNVVLHERNVEALRKEIGGLR